MEGARKVGVEFGLLALILAAGLILANPGVLLLALPFAVHIMFGLILAEKNALPRLRAERHLSSRRIYEDDSVEVKLAVENQGEGLELALVTEEGLPAEHVEGPTSLIGQLPKGGSLSLSYLAWPRRGFYPLEGVHLRVRDLLGFVSWEGELPCPTPLWVLPHYERLVELELSPRRTLSASGRARSRRGGVGVQFFATRPYIPGDDLRRLNWKALARRDQPVVNLYEEERAAEVTVVLDGRERVYRDLGGQELFEQAVRACAALCDSVIQEGHRTGLLLYGERLEWVFPGYGRAHRERLLQGLARAEMGFSEVFAELENLPARLFPSGSSLIIVSPLALGDEQTIGALRARGYDVLVLVLAPSLPKETGRTPIGLASRLAGLERELMLRVLYAAGVRLAVWDANRPLAPLVRAAWGRGR
ncbi:MAG: DUF58 domain-containing protein [Candidatus Bipolaricaulia bacterium]